MSIPVSGMNAAMTRLEVSASNIANSSTRGIVPATPASQPIPTVAVGGGPQVYQALDAVQTAISGHDTHSGVAVRAEPRLPSYSEEYEPSAPYANADGFVAAPNVDPLRETVEQVSAVQGFEASVAVFRASDAMIVSLLKTID
ncbi:flagellar basal body protein [Aurantimonas sp. VKM B-3413]|nr:flagellar basal body protein [Aurantimonas sp. VKM B-3413]